MGRNWDAVAEAINTRLAELDMTQVELAGKSRVSTATLRQLQHGVAKRYSPRTLAAISGALSWPSDHLERVATGSGSPAAVDRIAALEEVVADLRERVRRIEDAAPR